MVHFIMIVSYIDAQRMDFGGPRLARGAGHHKKKWPPQGQPFFMVKQTDLLLFKAEFNRQVELNSNGTATLFTRGPF